MRARYDAKRIVLNVGTLRAALVGEPDFLSEQSPVGNPLSLTFAL